MATTKVRNISGVDKVVPLPDGDRVEVLANHQAEFDADFAKSLLEQVDAWEKVKDTPSKKDGD